MYTARKMYNIKSVFRYWKVLHVNFCDKVASTTKDTNESIWTARKYEVQCILDYPCMIVSC